MATFTAGSTTFFDNVPLAPPNSILGVALECKKDTAPEKVDLTIGAYRNNNGAPHVLQCVREAEKKIFEAKLDHEYLSQDGDANFIEASQILLLGEDSSVINDGRIYSIQGLSGTGSLRLACDFIQNFLPSSTVYYPSTTWPNHPTMLEAANVKMATYRYLDASGCALDFNGLLEDLSMCPEGSIILLHLCAHNPTGVDPTDEQWRQIIDVMKTRRLLPFFDNAYQGFVSGCPHKDAFAARLFATTGLEMMIACSFAKNFGLYGDRIGVLHMVTANSKAVPNVASQLRVVSRALYSTCPTHGARIVARILGDLTLKTLWEQECKAMADRLSGVREKLYSALVDLNVKGTWDHVVQQRGMFSYTGITAPVVKRLKDEYHIYMLANGRISLAGLNESNIEKFAKALLEIMGSN